MSFIRLCVWGVVLFMFDCQEKDLSFIHVSVSVFQKIGCSAWQRWISGDLVGPKSSSHAPWGSLGARYSDFGLLEFGAGRCIVLLLRCGRIVEPLLEFNEFLRPRIGTTLTEYGSICLDCLVGFN